MKTISFYKWALGGMFMLNLMLLVFIFLGRPPHGHQHDSGGAFKDQSIKDLKLDKKQIDRFSAIVKEHHMNMVQLKEDQQMALLPYFHHLIDSSNTDLNTQLNEFLSLEKQKITITYQHFEAIKQLLKPDQAPHFEGFMKRATDLLLFKNKKREKHKK